MEPTAGKPPQPYPLMTPRRARLYMLLIFLIGLGVAAGMVLFALRDNISYFRTPTDVVTGHCPECAAGRGFRLGGLVEQGSLKRTGDIITFQVTDLKNTLTIRYRGVPPDLFREGQGVIAEGRMAPDGVFQAQSLLAKHDERYEPPEIARELKGKIKPH